MLSKDSLRSLLDDVDILLMNDDISLEEKDALEDIKNAIEELLPKYEVMAWATPAIAKNTINIFEPGQLQSCGTYDTLKEASDAIMEFRNHWNNWTAGKEPWLYFIRDVA